MCALYRLLHVKRETMTGTNDQGPGCVDRTLFQQKVRATFTSEAYSDEKTDPAARNSLWFGIERFLFILVLAAPFFLLA